jgi:hypothetical protein
LRGEKEKKEERVSRAKTGESRGRIKSQKQKNPEEESRKYVLKVALHN